MAVMIRKQIYISRRQAAKLKRQARELRTSEAQLIRRAIDRQIGLTGHPDLRLWQKELDYIQSLIDKGPVPGKRTWRREDLYDRPILAR